MKFLTEIDAMEVAAMERRLTEFYTSTSEYTPFAQESWHVAMWKEVLRYIRASSKATIRVLELGSGKSGLGRFLAETDPELRQRIHLCGHDVTQSNREHLEMWFDEVVFGPMENIRESWDVITHGYVFEHVARPRSFLSHALDLLVVGGLHVFQCPRYDFPFYAPPALDHLSGSRKWSAVVRLMCSRREFLLVGDPAVFHLPYRRDRDAIHVVRKRDVWRACAERAWLKHYDVRAGGPRDFLLKHFLTLRVLMIKRG
jgi:SAM-dependent methyltransferase